MKKILLTLMIFVSLCTFSESDNFQRIIPNILIIENNLERTLLDYSASDELRLNQMLAPVGWTEGIVALEFELRGIVISGTLGLEFKNETITFKKDDGFVIPKNTKVRIHNAGDEPLHLVEVLRPGYKEEFVKEYQNFEE